MSSVAASAPTALLETYLHELGLAAAPAADVAGLRLVHRRHVQRFAHDTVWIARGRLPVLEEESMLRALLAGEGGGCLQLNAGHAWLLRALGFEVTLHRARVQRAFEAAPDPRPDAHVVPVVHLDGDEWVTDVGLGTGLLEPVRLREGALEQEGGFRYALRPSTDPGHAWQFHHDPRLLVLRVVEWERAEAALGDFDAAYALDTGHPDSLFRRHVTAALRGPDRVTALTGPTLVVRGDGGRQVRTLRSAQEWEGVLREVFLLGLPDWTTQERDRLWQQVTG